MNDNPNTEELPGPCGHIDLGASVPTESDEALASLAKAVAHPVRLQIVRLLSSRTTCVCGEIVELLPLAQSTVSEHLRVLKEAGLVKGEVDGPRVCYGIDPEGLSRLKRLVEEL